MHAVLRFALAVTAVAAVSCTSTKSAESGPPSDEAAAEAPAAEAPASEAPAAEAPASEAPASEAGAAETPRPWADGRPVKFDELPDDLKAPYMKEVVMPRMREVFSRLDEPELKDVKCTTCHGENPKERKFEMPSPTIHVVDFQKDKAEHPEEFKFMAEVVVPEMARLLGEEPYDPATQKGFGCTGCHTVKQH